MKTISNPLMPVTVITAVLLVAGALLSVLGIYEDLLNWDLVSPVVQASMMAVWFLGAFGVALTVVLGIREMVTIFRNSTTERYPEETGRSG